MHEIHLYLIKLTEYFDAKTASANDIRQQYSNQLPQHVSVSAIINHLTEIASECRSTRDSTVFDNTHDSWEYFSKIVSVEHLVGFFMGLIELTAKHQNDFQYVKLALSLCRTYLLLLTSPGAKIFGAFDTDLLGKLFKTFGYIKHTDKFSSNEASQLQMLLIVLLQDIQIYLKHVSFNEYEEQHIQFIECLAMIMEFHHEKGIQNKYSFEIQELCYGTLENACLPIHNTDISASMLIVLNGTVCLTRFHRPCNGMAHYKPKFALITDWFIDMLKHFPKQTCDTLECYIKAILTDPDITANRDLMIRYLDICAEYDAAMVRICGQSIGGFLEELALSKESTHRCNCVELIHRMLIRDTRCEWEIFRAELPKIPREIALLKILVQKFYDSNNVVAMKAINAFMKITGDGNFICKSIISKIFFETQLSEHDQEIAEHEGDEFDRDGIDMNDISDCIDLVNKWKEKRLQEKSTKNTNAPNANETSAKTVDSVTTENANSEQNQKDDAMNGGNENATSIEPPTDDPMNGNRVDRAGSEVRRDDDATSMTSSSRQSVTDEEIAQSVEYKSLLDEIKTNLVRAIKYQMKNSSALVRRVAVLIIEFLGKTTVNINELLTSYELKQLFIDQSQLVRRQLVLSLDSVMNTRPSSAIAMTAWVKVVLDLANDIDPKVMEIVIESFKRNIFDKIEMYEQSSSLRHVFPWRILRMMLNCKDSPDFRISVQKWMDRSLLNTRTLTKIESHLDTSNATEAWILLAIVAPTTHGHNPERVSRLLLGNLKYDMTNTVEKCFIQLEVLSFWLDHLKTPSKNEIKSLMNDALKAGSMGPRIVNRTFGICYKLCATSSEKDRKRFVKELRQICEKYILLNRNLIFVPNLCDTRFVSYAYLYAEIGSIATTPLNQEIINFFLSFLEAVAKQRILTVRTDSMLPDKISCMLGVLTAMSSYSQEICARFVPHLGRIMRLTDDSEVSITSIKCLGFLCKKHTAVVETILPYILEKTQHRFTAVREYAIKNLAALILEDYLKFRGNLLIHVFAGLLDKERDIKDLVVELIMKYTSEKNEIFLRTCLLECPFVFNNCACFGQNEHAAKSKILMGASKKAAREHIYQYLLRKIDPIYLYMYFENMTRLLEFIEKVPSLAKAHDLQASVLDFLFICSQICVVNEKHKRNLEKIIKESHDGEGLSIDGQQKKDSTQETEGGENEKKGGRGNKKTGPTLTSSLAVVERILPSVAAIHGILQKTNPKYFNAALDTLCDNMCTHFESLIEYAQPREFWQPLLKQAKQAQAAAKKTTRKTAQDRPGSTTPRSRAGTPRSRAGTPRSRAPTPRSRAGTPRLSVESPRSRAPTPRLGAGTPKSRAETPSAFIPITPTGNAAKPPIKAKTPSAITTTPSRSRRAKENDSGLCTIDDVDDNYFSDESAFSELTISEVQSKKRAPSQRSVAGSSTRHRKTARR